MTGWNPTPIERDGATLFRPWYAFHVDHYSPREQLAMSRQISFVRMLLTKPHRESYRWFRRFRSLTPIGEPAPDLELPLVGGGTIRLAELRGRVVAFMFVAMTCPPARTQVERWRELRERWAEEEVALFVVYSRERHPGEPGYRSFCHARTDERKWDHAAMLAATTDLPVAVDGIDEPVLATYGKVPNAAFVVDPEGRLVFKSTWADADKIRLVVDRLLERRPGP